MSLPAANQSLLVREALTAALALLGTKQVWLLDDGDDPALAELAQQMGSGYLTRAEHGDAKAGNINTALPRTQGDVIAIFDIDHAPKPEFLEKSLGYFRDPQLGFVQVMLTFRNIDESWVARVCHREQPGILQSHVPGCRPGGRRYADGQQCPDPADGTGVDRRLPGGVGGGPGHIAGAARSRLAQRLCCRAAGAGTQPKQPGGVVGAAAEVGARRV